MDNLNNANKTSPKALAWLLISTMTLVGIGSAITYYLTYKTLNKLQSQVYLFNRTTPLYRWTLSELNYLIRIAYYRFNVEQNVGAAKQLLETGLKRLKQTPYPEFKTLQVALEEDIALLQAAPKFDKASSLKTLGTLSKTVIALANAKLPAGSGSQEKPPDLKSPLTKEGQMTHSWGGRFQQGLEAIMTSIKQWPYEAITLEQTNPDNPSQNALLERLALVQMALYQATWVLQQNNVPALHALYQTSLSEAEFWLKQSGLAQGPAIKAMLDHIDRLKSEPALTDTKPPGLENARRVLDHLWQASAKEDKHE